MFEIILKWVYTIQRQRTKGSKNNEKTTNQKNNKKFIKDS